MTARSFLLTVPLAVSAWVFLTLPANAVCWAWQPCANQQGYGYGAPPPLCRRTAPCRQVRPQLQHRALRHRRVQPGLRNHRSLPRSPRRRRQPRLKPHPHRQSQSPLRYRHRHRQKQRRLRQHQRLHLCLLRRKRFRSPRQLQPSKRFPSPYPPPRRFRRRPCRSLYRCLSPCRPRAGPGKGGAATGASACSCSCSAAGTGPGPGNSTTGTRTSSETRTGAGRDARHGAGHDADGARYGDHAGDPRIGDVLGRNCLI